MSLYERLGGAVAGHLQSTLQDLNVPQERIAQGMTIAAVAHDDVLDL